MPHAIRIHKHGGPDVLAYEQVEVGAPGPGEVRLRQRAVGVNYIDTYQRSGLYKLASLPAIIGLEGAGDVVAVGVVGVVVDEVASPRSPVCVKLLTGSALSVPFRLRPLLGE